MQHKRNGLYSRRSFIVYLNGLPYITRRHTLYTHIMGCGLVNSILAAPILYSISCIELFHIIHLYRTHERTANVCYVCVRCTQLRSIAFYSVNIALIGFIFVGVLFTGHTFHVYCKCAHIIARVSHPNAVEMDR